MPVSGHVVDLVTAAADVGREVDVDDVGQEVHWVSGFGPGRKRIRLNRKTPAHLVGLLIHSRPRVWKRLRHVGFSGKITLGGVVIMLMGVLFLNMTGLGWVISLGAVQAHVSRFARLLLSRSLHD